MGGGAGGGMGGGAGGGMGGGAGGAGIDPIDIPKGNPIPLEEAAATFAERVCGVIQRCDCAEAPSGEECITALTELMTGEIGTNQGRGLTYDPECFEPQIQLYELYGCRSVAGLRGDDEASLSACRLQACQVFSGDRPEGAECADTKHSLGSACAPGLVCSSFGKCIQPACLPWRGAGALGEACSNDEGGRACVEGAYCDTQGTKRCQDIPTEGESCTGSYFCEPGSTCQDSTGGDRADAICKAPLAEGTPCSSNTGCAEGLACVTPAGAEVGTCTTPLADGQPCTTAGECASGHCPFNVEPRVCTPTPGAGEPCSERCQEGLVCNYGLQPIVCGVPGEEDGPCRPDRSCDEGLVCSRNGACRRPLPDGSACMENADVCAEGLECHPFNRVCGQPEPAICGFVR
jgi:hypothetical protein